MPLPHLNSPEAQTALQRFLEAPARRTVEPLLLACREFVVAQAQAWRQPAMALQDRCREILSEVFLILMEEVVGKRLVRPDSLLAYMALRLRRLTRPKKGWVLSFGLDEDLPDSGRTGFTPLRLDLVREIVGEIRRTLVSEPREDTRALEFLFIHVRPELAWASRLLAGQAGQPLESRQEVDKKRHQAFHRQVRARFDDLTTGDWHEIAAWSAGERSHLAWSIIDLAADEADRLGAAHHEALEIWRDAPDRPEAESALARDLVPRCLQALAEAHRCSRPRPEVAEEPAPYGHPTEVPDLFSLLFPPVVTPPDTRTVREPGASYEVGDHSGKPVPLRMPMRTRMPLPDAAAPEAAFTAAMAEILAWSAPLLEDRPPQQPFPGGRQRS